MLLFVRRRAPKQGELRTDVSKATMFQGVGKLCDPGSNRRSIHYFRFKFRFSSGNQLCANRVFSQYRRQWFEPLLTPSVAKLDVQLCTNSKRILLITVGYDGHLRGSYGVVKMWSFADLRHSFVLTHNLPISIPKFQIPTATKITSSCSLRIHLPLWACTTTSHFRKTTVLRLHCNNPFAPVQNIRKSASHHNPV